MKSSFRRWAVSALSALAVAAVGAGLLPGDSPSGANCSFQNSPDEFLSAQSRAHKDAFDRAKSYRFGIAGRTVAPQSIERRNFIDDAIFTKIADAGAQSAPIAGDEEFLRRVTLDLTGRLPSPATVRAFVADEDPGKRDRAIDALLASPEFTDKWSMWMGDWLRNSATNASSYSPEQLAGRNAFYKFIWMSVAANKSLRELTYEILSAYGNNFDENSGQANFISSAGAPGGPAQDTYDAMLVKSATTFLGLGHYDCLLCHNGRNHLEQLSVWARGVNRQDAQKMAAFFARTNLVRWTPPPGVPNDNTQFYFNSYSMQDAVRTYDLNTNFGNRPNRVSNGPVVRLSPEYRDTLETPKSANWRIWFAAFILDDPMFSKNIVNRVWKQMFTLALAEPVDGLDPARLDPANPPPDPWTFQATHPELLVQLANEFAARGYDLRQLLKLITSSSAYQLSSRYDGEWKIDYVPLFARHYPRRLDGEEVHDAICTATGIFNKYTQFNWGDTVSYAMQLLDSVEPRNNTNNAATFMNYFLRGNRDTTTRSQLASVQQGMALMNDSFVTAKIKMNASPVLQAAARLPSNDAIIEEMFLKFISRKPTEYERTRAISYFAKATTAAQKNAVIEDLAWSLINKIEFLFSY